MPVRYPIAANAEAALSAPLGRAARESEARELVGSDLGFVRELTGPAFATRGDAETAYAGRVDIAGAPLVESEDRYCNLAEVIAGASAAEAGQAEPVFEHGHRWPKPSRPLQTVWRLSIGYWRLAADPVHNADLPQARAARRKAKARELEPAALRAMARQPLRPVQPQQPLDIGLFEVHPPEAPHIIMPDE
jgi:hypothetical protein